MRENHIFKFKATLSQLKLTIFNLRSGSTLKPTLRCFIGQAHLSLIVKFKLNSSYKHVFMLLSR